MNGLFNTPLTSRSEAVEESLLARSERRHVPSDQVLRFEASVHARNPDSLAAGTARREHGDITRDGEDRASVDADASRTGLDRTRVDNAPPPDTTLVPCGPSSFNSSRESESAVATHLTELIAQLCSALYVESTHMPGRIVIAFDSALPVAAAEFFRDGTRLRVRLHPRDRQSMTLLDAHLDALSNDLRLASRQDVHIEIGDAP